MTATATVSRYDHDDNPPHPNPQAQAFVACRKITNDPQTGEIVITGPVSHVSYGPVEPVPPWEWRKAYQHGHAVTAKAPL